MACAHPDVREGVAGTGVLHTTRSEDVLIVCTRACMATLASGFPCPLLVHQAGSCQQHERIISGLIPC